MDKIFEKLQNFLVEKINEKLTEIESPEKVELTKELIHFGAVDSEKIASKIFVVVLPESQEETDDDIEDYCENSEFEISFVFKKDKYEILLKRMCLYASALREVVIENPSMNGEAEEITIGARKFLPDCGATERTMTAFQTALTIKTSENFE